MRRKRKQFKKGRIFTESWKRTCRLIRSKVYFNGVWLKNGTIKTNSLMEADFVKNAQFSSYDIFPVSLLKLLCKSMVLIISFLQRYSYLATLIFCHFEDSYGKNKSDLFQRLSIGVVNKLQQPLHSQLTLDLLKLFSLTAFIYQLMNFWLPSLR